MIHNIGARNVPEAYVEGRWVMESISKKQNSRNGEVLTALDPVVLTIMNPDQRVLFDPVRDANPFFHVMEFVWMMAGSNDAEWISMFNKRMMEYSDANAVLRGAYGWRWQNPKDQIPPVISLLKKDPTTRQAVLSMWDPAYDGPEATSSDRPCNTTIYFRVENNRLNMTVCNRSNDMIWGMLGANAVHMTMLQELIARAAGYELGTYHVFTNNLHVYTEMPRFDELWHGRILHDPYIKGLVKPMPLLQPGEDYRDFMGDCLGLVHSDLLRTDMRTQWIREVACPMYDAYLFKEKRSEHIAEIKADDWRMAAEQWAGRRKKKVA